MNDCHYVMDIYYCFGKNFTGNFKISIEKLSLEYYCRLARPVVPVGPRPTKLLSDWLTKGLPISLRSVEVVSLTISFNQLLVSIQGVR